MSSIGARATRTILLVTMLVAALGLGGCSRLPFLGSQAPAPEDVDFAKRYLALFGTRSLPAIEMGLDPVLRQPQMRLRLAQMMAVVPPGEPSAIHLTEANVTRAGGTTSTTLSFQYDYSNRYLLSEIVIERKNGAQVVRGVQIRALRDSLDRLNRIELQSRTWRHYTMLAASLAVLGVILYALVLIVRTPVRGPKWVWAVAVVPGIVQFVFNWTAGTVSIVPMGLQIFGSGFARPSPYLPLVITTSIPVGAIIFLVQRLEWSHDDDDEGDFVHPEDGPGAPSSLAAVGAESPEPERDATPGA